MRSVDKMNKAISRYMQQNIKYPLLIEEAPHANVGMIIVIPCYDEPDVVGSIRAIAHCSQPECHVEIIIVINASSADDPAVWQQNEESYRGIHAIAGLPNWLRVYAIMNNGFDPKRSGVGLARKIGLDDAVRRFVDLEREDGILVCFDADSLCEKNYLVELERAFIANSYASVGIDYHHPLSGEAHTEDIYHYISQYELHLRYFIDIQKRIGLPYAYHTVGSSMACTVLAYCSVGGMNQRQAGEDFYFLHKLIKYGKHGEVNTTKVIPSPRVSHRVPFGTGKAVADLHKSPGGEYFTYAPESFYDLKKLVDFLPDIAAGSYGMDVLPEPLRTYLQSIDGERNLRMISDNTSDWPSFEKRFWQWFDAFQLMKYLHFVRERWYPDIAVRTLGTKFFEREMTVMDMLLRMRADFT